MEHLYIAPPEGYEGMLLHLCSIHTVPPVHGQIYTFELSTSIRNKKLELLQYHAGTHEWRRLTIG